MTSSLSYFLSAPPSPRFEKKKNVPRTYFISYLCTTAVLLPFLYAYSKKIVLKEDLNNEIYALLSGRGSAACERQQMRKEGLYFYFYSYHKHLILCVHKKNAQ